MSTSIVHVHGACPCPCCMSMSMVHVHVPAACMSMSLLHVHAHLHVHVHAACPCPWRMSMSMLHVYVHSTRLHQCYTYMSMRYVQNVHVLAGCSSWNRFSTMLHVHASCLFPYLCCISMSMVHVHVHGTCPCPWCMFIVQCTCCLYMCTWLSSDKYTSEFWLSSVFGVSNFFVNQLWSTPQCIHHRGVLTLCRCINHGVNYEYYIICLLGPSCFRNKPKTENLATLSH